MGDEGGSWVVLTRISEAVLHPASTQLRRSCTSLMPRWLPGAESRICESRSQPVLPRLLVPTSDTLHKPLQPRSRDCLAMATMEVPPSLFAGGSACAVPWRSCMLFSRQCCCSPPLVY